MLSTLSSSLKPVKMQNKKRKNDTEPKVKMSKAGKVIICIVLFF